MYNKVWIIDDSDIDRMIAEQVLKHSDFARQVVSFPYAQELLSKLLQPALPMTEIPEMIFLDIHMPGMSGIEFLANWSGLSATIRDHCKIVVLSSITAKQQAEQLKDLRFVAAVLHKPLKKEMLTGMI